MPPGAGPILEYFAGFARRWGLEPDACRLHALLYLHARPLTREEAARELGIDAAALAAAAADLAGWGLLQPAPEGRLAVSPEPFDLVFGALEARRRRELAEALAALETGAAQAAEAPPLARRQIARLSAVFADLDAIDLTALPSGGVMRQALSAGGRAARFLHRFSRPAQEPKS